MWAMRYPKPIAPVTAITVFFPTVESQNLANMLDRWSMRGKTSSLDRIITKLSSLMREGQGRELLQTIFPSCNLLKALNSAARPDIDSIILPLPQAWPAA